MTQLNMCSKYNAKEYVDDSASTRLDSIISFVSHDKGYRFKEHSEMNVFQATH